MEDCCNCSKFTASENYFPPINLGIRLVLLLLFSLVIVLLLLRLMLLTRNDAEVHTLMGFWLLNGVFAG